jgi:hypothetical protein
VPTDKYVQIERENKILLSKMQRILKGSASQPSLTGISRTAASGLIHPSISTNLNDIILMDLSL